jgi:hypothetical protein
MTTSEQYLSVSQSNTSQLLLRRSVKLNAEQIQARRRLESERTSNIFSWVSDNIFEPIFRKLDKGVRV